MPKFGLPYIPKTKFSSKEYYDQATKILGEILSPNRFLVQKNHWSRKIMVLVKNIVPKNFGSQVLLSHKKMCVKWFCVEKLVPKIVWVWVQNNSRSNKNVGPKN